MFVEYASKDDICNALSPYKVGDRVLLLNDKNDMCDNGLFEQGTEMIIHEIRLNDDVYTPQSIRKDKLSDYSFVGENVFKYILKQSDSDNDSDKRVCCFESDFYDIHEKNLDIIVNTATKLNKTTFIIISAVVLTLSLFVGIIFILSSDLMSDTQIVRILGTAVVLAFIIAILTGCNNDLYNAQICRKSKIKGYYVIQRKRKNYGL